VLPLLKKAGLDCSQQANYRPPCPKSWRDSCWHACAPTCSTLPISASSSRHTEKNTPWTYWRSSMESSRRSSQAGHCPDRTRSVGSLRHRRPPARVRSDGNPTPLAASGCSQISTAGSSSSRWANTNHTPLKSTWAPLCLQSTAAQSPTSSVNTAFSITNTPTARSSISPCAPTTHPPGCPF